MGDEANASGQEATAVGSAAAATGDGSAAIGLTAIASETNAAAFGASAQATEVASLALGNSAAATSLNAIAVGNASSASANNAAAFGSGAAASGTNATAVGYLASASGANSSAFGNGASASFANSAAFGAGATTTRANQQVFGTVNNTITAPGITSDASRAAQSGPVEFVTTDAAGNLASDGGDIISQIGINSAGVAIALASQAPDLAGDENFGVRFNYAIFDGENHGLSFNAAGVLARDLFTENDRLTLDAGVGYGVGQRIGGGSEDTFSGRVGLQLTW